MPGFTIVEVKALGGAASPETAKDAVKAATEVTVDAEKSVTEKPRAEDDHHGGAGDHHEDETGDGHAKEKVEDHHDDVPHAH